MLRIEWLALAALMAASSGSGGGNSAPPLREASAFLSWPASAGPPVRAGGEKDAVGVGTLRKHRKFGHIVTTDANVRARVPALPRDSARTWAYDAHMLLLRHRLVASDAAICGSALLCSVIFLAALTTTSPALSTMARLTL